MLLVMAPKGTIRQRRRWRNNIDSPLRVRDGLVETIKVGQFTKCGAWERRLVGARDRADIRRISGRRSTTLPGQFPSRLLNQLRSAPPNYLSPGQ